MKKNEKTNNRRKFLNKSLKLGAILASGSGLAMNHSALAKEEGGAKIKLLTTDGKVVEVDKSQVDCKITPCEPPQGKEARKGIPGRKFVMVIDLARCKNARKCIEACQRGHNLQADQEWMSVFLMKDHPNSEPYWFPRNCYHCGNPPCVKVCPVGATFKREDNTVLVDVNRCIGCKFCVVACPYSARIFNWKKPNDPKVPKEAYSPETSTPAQIGTVSKCDFCPDLSRKGKLPYCVTGCPMGAIYFGDKNENAVSNGTETLKFEELIAQRAGYRYLEKLGTEPNVYYLPPIDRMFDYESGLEGLSEERKKMYEKVISDTTKKK